MSVAQYPVEKHLHTNYVPSDGEIAMQKMSPIALVRRKALVDTVDAHRRVPLGILQEIFLSCLDPALEEDRILYSATLELPPYSTLPGTTSLISRPIGVTSH
ncbi:hypothetical protein C8R44DRAFT_870991 [Mycena epipterygia]|nr:hypothetical protein C8R44DRAFT_870991 [Mycena epipterygia]